MLNLFTPFISVHSYSELSQYVKGSLHQRAVCLQALIVNLKQSHLVLGGSTSCFIRFLSGSCGGSKFAICSANLHGDGDQRDYCCELSYHKVVSVAISQLYSSAKGGLA